MMKIKWHNGLILSDELFIEQDKIAQNIRTEALSLIYAESVPCIVSIDFDQQYWAEAKLKLTHISFIDAEGNIQYYSDMHNRLNLLDLNHYDSESDLAVHVNFKHIEQTLGKDAPFQVMQLMPELGTFACPDAALSIKLIELKRNDQRIWQLTANYLANTYFVDKFLQRILLKKLNELCDEILQFINSEISYLPVSQSHIYLQLLTIKKLTFQLATLLAKIKSGQMKVTLSALYDTLYQLYIDSWLIKNAEEPSVILLDKHNIAVSFGTLIDHIQGLFSLKLTGNAYTRMLPRSDYAMIYECGLSAETQYAEAIYLIIRKQDASTYFKSEEIFVAPSSSIKRMMQLYLPGIKLKKYHGKIADQSFNKLNCEIYQLEPDHDWQTAINEEKLSVFINSPHHNLADYYLYIDIPRKFAKKQQNVASQASM
ncbi:type VI secretion system baseplate subunit TssK [Cysteiniphilum litorale]|nr:type VI secretion system baseplate subunit TssK [Cysteiniphilum litorale]